MPEVAPLFDSAEPAIGFSPRPWQSPLEQLPGVQQVVLKEEGEINHLRFLCAALEAALHIELLDS